MFQSFTAIIFKNRFFNKETDNSLLKEIVNEVVEKVEEVKEKIEETKDIINEESKVDTPKEKVLIVGGGMSGISSAYFLAKKGTYDITVIERDFQLKGATEQNANTITFIPYPAWTTINFKNVLKETFSRSENPSSYFKFSLIFDSQFRFWCKHYFKNRSQDKVKQSNKALANLISYSISLYDDYIADVTGNNPDLVDYHEETLTTVYRNLTKEGIKEKEKLLKNIQQYEKT